MLVERFAASFRNRFPDLVGRRLLVALSGGADSVALVHLLHQTRRHLQLSLQATHVRHHLRGEESDGDAVFCSGLCADLGIPLHLVDLEPTPPRGYSPEAWWRMERFRLFDQICEAQGCAAVATAHTLDDQAETVLLKLLRGAGPRAVAGIRPRRRQVVRPLLEFSRDALRSWLHEQHLGWREDSTNAAIDRPRTWIRHRLLPELEDHFPHVTSHLAAFATATLEAEELVSREVDRRVQLPTIRRSVAISSVQELEHSLRVRWVLALADLLPLSEPPSRSQLAAIDTMLDGRQPSAVDLGRRWVLRLRSDQVVLSPPPVSAFSSVPASGEVRLPGRFVGRVGISRGGHRAWLDERAFKARLAWRSLVAGERFAGVRARRRLAEANVPPEWRSGWPVLEADGTMVWIPAVGVAPGWEGEAGRGVVVELEEPWGCFERS